MKVDLISDIHLEMFESFAEEPDFEKIFKTQGSDILMIAGDTAQCLPSTMNDLVEDLFTFVSKRYKHVFYVLGNHDYWNRGIWFDKERYNLETMRSESVKRYPEVTFLSPSEPVFIDGYGFIGDTLWTNPRPHNYSLIARRMNDYGEIYKAFGENLTVKDTVEVHNRTIKAFSDTLTKYKDTPFVVLSHHQPFPNKVRFGDPLNDAYATDLSNFILIHPNIRLWGCGHDHEPIDNMVCGCRIVSNPHGYVVYENTRDKGVKTFEI